MSIHGYQIVQQTQHFTIDPATGAVYRDCIVRTPDGQLWEAGILDTTEAGA